MDITRNNIAKFRVSVVVATDNLTGNIADAVASEAVEEIDRLIYDTPESPNYKRTRNLRNSIRVEKLTGGEIQVVAGGHTGGQPRAKTGEFVKQGYKSATGKKDAPYATAVHEGTPSMAARPFLTNAARQVNSQLVKLKKVWAEDVEKGGSK